MTKKPKIIFMGTPEFAVPTLMALHEAGFTPVAVISAPSRPAGRGLKPRDPAVAEAAKSLGIPLFQPEKLKDPKFLETYKSFEPDLNIVVAFRMLPKEIWAYPSLGTFNLHGSLLPQYRGAAPIQHAIMNGENQTGLTTFFINEQIDTGAILLQETVDIGPEENAGILHDRMMHIGARLVVKTVNGLLNGELSSINQSEIIENKSLILKYAPKIQKEDCWLDPSLPGKNIYDKIRGLSPYPGAYFTLSNISNETTTLKVFSARWEATNHAQTPGTLEIRDGNRVFVALNDGFLELLEVQSPGRKKLDIKTFLLGTKLDEWKISGQIAE